MIESSIDALRNALREWRFLEDCLLHDLRLVQFGFGIDLTFNYVWSDENQVRSDVLEKPKLITLRLIGVESLNLRGGLTGGMIDNPELINWGLSEVARVEPVEGNSGLALSIYWEGSRR